MIQVLISFVDGSSQEYEENDSFVDSLQQLKEQGYKGKPLVHVLITDDWGTPPLYVKILGVTSTGKEINEHIPYN